MRFNWKKTLLITLDVALGAYIVVAFASFNKPKEEAPVCKKVSIDIQDETTNGFITAAEIKARLQKGNIYPLNKRMRDINARTIEETLGQSPFVKTTQCYKTQDGTVHIYLTQRMPTLRIKAANGEDYYLDDDNRIMPNSHYTSDLIIATGHINKWFARNYVAHVGSTLMASDFWKNQIVQINVLPDYGIELVPRVGNHIIYIGQLPQTSYVNDRKILVTAYVNTKLDRLQKFYKYGLAQAGWNKYSYINVEFDNQIICKKQKLN